MSGETDLALMLATIAVDRRPGTFCFVTDVGALADSAQAMVQEDEGPTVVVPIEVAREHGIEPEFIASWLTLRVHSSLAAVGLTAAVARALAEADIPCNVIAGFHHDHLLVPVDRAEAAISAIEGLATPRTP